MVIAGRWGRCLLIMLPSEIIRAQEFEPRYSDGLIRAAAAYCDGKALGRIDDQIYVSANKWLHCMIVDQRCEHVANADGADVRSSILGCPIGPHSSDYETERAEFWRRHDELQTECTSAIGGPCGFSSQLLSDDEIAKIPGSDLSSPDPVP